MYLNLWGYNHLCTYMRCKDDTRPLSIPLIHRNLYQTKILLDLGISGCLKLQVF